MQASSASSPVWPNGVWPRSWPSATASARSSSSAERAGQRAGDLRDLDRVGEAGAEMVALVVDEHLRLVGEAAEGGRMDDAVAVALEAVRVGDGGSATRRPRERAGIGGVGARQLARAVSPSIRRPRALRFARATYLSARRRSARDRRGRDEKAQS